VATENAGGAPKAKEILMGFPAFFIRRRFAALLTTAVIAAATVSAVPVIQGVGNFQEVNDHIYRGAQPTDDGFANLKKLGIETVVDLREPGDRSALEQKVVTAAGMRYVSVPMYGMSTPSNESVQKVLALLEDTSSGPVFVHCKRGADRTGAVIACYRVEHDRWKNQQALAEAKSLGMSWFEKAIQSYVLTFQPRNLEALAAKTLNASAAVVAPVQP
jgi:tyrosine-protein phosphatase SIW14